MHKWLGLIQETCRDRIYLGFAAPDEVNFATLAKLAYQVSIARCFLPRCTYLGINITFRA